MDENQKKQVVAEAENLEALRDFFVEWYSYEQLYETMAKACTLLIYLDNHGQLCDEDKKVLEDLMMQHESLIEHIKPFRRKDGEV